MFCTYARDVKRVRKIIKSISKRIYTHGYNSGIVRKYSMECK